MAGHRPAWQDALYQPRLTVQKQFPPLQRFDGRPVDPLIVFGADDRWSFKDSAWPWGLVGKIFTSSGWTGSGVLVGERLVVTAGHVVPWADVAAGSWWMKFVPAYYDGSSLYGAGVESYVSARDSPTSSGGAERTGRLRHSRARPTTSWHCRQGPLVKADRPEAGCSAQARRSLRRREVPGYRRGWRLRR